jgi:hypothetical protein
MICKLLEIEIEIGMMCPSSKNYKKRFCCYKNCGFSPLRDKSKKRIIQTTFKNL